MDDFKNKIAVVTGGGTGMGRELVRQLAREGSHVAMCDVLEDNMLETFEIVSKETSDLLVLKKIIEEELFELSEAHYQRYFKLEDNLNA